MLSVLKVWQHVHQLRECRLDDAHTCLEQNRKPFSEQAYLSGEFGDYVCATHINEQDVRGFMAFRSVSPLTNPYQPMQCSIPQCPEGQYDRNSNSILLSTASPTLCNTCTNTCTRKALLTTSADLNHHVSRIIRVYMCYCGHMICEYHEPMERMQEHQKQKHGGENVHWTAVFLNSTRNPGA